MLRKMLVGAGVAAIVGTAGGPAAAGAICAFVTVTTPSGATHSTGECALQTSLSTRVTRERFTVAGYTVEVVVVRP